MHLVPAGGDGEAFRDAVAERTPNVKVDVLLPGESLPLPQRAVAT
jgi:hypothetical protein